MLNAAVLSAAGGPELSLAAAVEAGLSAARFCMGAKFTAAFTVSVSGAEEALPALELRLSVPPLTVSAAPAAWVCVPLMVIVPLPERVSVLLELMVRLLTRRAAFVARSMLVLLASVR